MMNKKKTSIMDNRFLGPKRVQSECFEPIRVGKKRRGLWAPVREEISELPGKNPPCPDWDWQKL
jgi:hypothetical protein